METPTVTLQELADFLLALPDDAPINMYSGEYNDPYSGCLMTQYGKAKGWNCTFSFSSSGTWENESSNTTVANVECGNVLVSLFNKGEQVMAYVAKHWKDLLKDEFKK